RTLNDPRVESNTRRASDVRKPSALRAPAATMPAMPRFDARVRRRFAAGATLLVLLLAAAVTLDPLREGTTARYFSDAGWSPPVARTTRDTQFSTGGLIAAWRGHPPDSFSATWSGSLLAVRGGTYTFAI